MGLGRCCSSGNGTILLVQKRPIWDRLRFSFLALAIVLWIGVLIMSPTYVAFFQGGIGLYRESRTYASLGSNRGGTECP